MIIFVLNLLLFTSTWAELGIRFRRQGFLDLSATAPCTNGRGQTGLCIPIKQCPPLLNLLLTQRQQQDVADFLRTSVCGYEGVNPKVCCPRTTESTTTTTETILAKNPVTTTEASVIKQVDGIPEPGECGVSASQHTRVVGGTNATLGSWPWMVALGYKSARGGPEPVFSCAGSLITNRHVLTAAHCLTSKKTLFVARVGDLNLYSDNDGASPVDMEIARTISHEAYNPVTFTNDIALIVLKSPVTFTDNIKPICLPLSRELRSKDYTNRQPFIAGWGTVSYAGPGSANLLEVQLPVVSEKECKRAFQPFKTAVIDRRVICAGELRGGKDACRGDSGGPLMDPNSKDKLFYQIGVVSYGYKCAEEGFPGIYTRVTSFLDWILQKVESSS